jgi:hypothetical protein
MSEEFDGKRDIETPPSISLFFNISFQLNKLYHLGEINYPTFLLGNPD